MGSAGSGAHADVLEAEHAAVAAAAEHHHRQHQQEGGDDDWGDEDDGDKAGGLAIKVQSARLARWEWAGRTTRG